MYNLVELSNTHRSCIRSKSLFGFGGKLKLKVAESDVFDMDTETVYLTGQELARQIEVIKSIQTFGLDARKVMKVSHANYETTGDIWI